MLLCKKKNAGINNVIGRYVGTRVDRLSAAHPSREGLLGGRWQPLQTVHEADGLRASQEFPIAGGECADFHRRPAFSHRRLHPTHTHQADHPLVPPGADSLLELLFSKNCLRSPRAYA
jgi:hypothetical protein